MKNTMKNDGIKINDIHNDVTDYFIPYTLDIQQEHKLSVEMIRLFEELLPSKENHKRRSKFIKSMERMLNLEWPNQNIKVNVFGSSVNNLGTNSSDVDLCLTTNSNGIPDVRMLAKLFQKRGMQHVVCVPDAKVPIVRLFDSQLEISCDINVNNTLALQNTELIKAYVSLDPRVRPLTMIIKHWTKQRKINDAATGGTLSSYTWTCMIINFLQQRNPPILPTLHQINKKGKEEEYFFTDVHRLKGFGSKNCETLGGLMFAFFRRFAIEFDYQTQVVSVRQGRYLSKKEKNWDTGINKNSLCVEEPCNPIRNLGNSADVASVRGLRLEFKRSFDMLLSGESIETIFTPYEPPTYPKMTNQDEPSLSLTLSNYTTLNHSYYSSFLSDIPNKEYDLTNREPSISHSQGYFPPYDSHTLPCSIAFELALMANNIKSDIGYLSTSTASTLSTASDSTTHPPCETASRKPYILSEKSKHDPNSTTDSKLYYHYSKSNPYVPKRDVHEWLSVNEATQGMWADPEVHSFGYNKRPPPKNQRSEVVMSKPKHLTLADYFQNAFPSPPPPPPPPPKPVTVATDSKKKKKKSTKTKSDSAKNKNKKKKKKKVPTQV